MTAPSVLETIASALRESPTGLDSKTIAEQYLFFKNPDPKTAHIAVSAILKADRRLSCDKDRIWHIGTGAPPAQKSQNEDLTEQELRAVYLVFPANEGVQRPLHISIWSVAPEIKPLFSGWLTDPSTLTEEDREELADALDAPFTTARDTLSAAASLLESCETVYLSSAQRKTMLRYAEHDGFFLPEETPLIGSLMRNAGLTPPRPLSLDGCYLDIFGSPPAATSARRAGEALALCAQELRVRIANRPEIVEDDAPLWPHLSLIPDTAYLSTGPGVYGFKNAQGAYIYIGKAKNLRRRVATYFKQTDESPEKLSALRDSAFDMVIHPCGSELESLVQEYRLIRHHKPMLNTQKAISERKGKYTPVADCIVLQPSVDSDAVVTFWFRSDQKTAVRSINRLLPDGAGLTAAISDFFFSAKLPASPTDFAEQEIIQRWLKRHMDHLPVVWVGRYTDAREVAGSVVSLMRNER